LHTVVNLSSWRRNWVRYLSEDMNLWTQGKRCEGK
jgi:hypothetical protein